MLSPGKWGSALKTSSPSFEDHKLALMVDELQWQLLYLIPKLKKHLFSPKRCYSVQHFSKMLRRICSLPQVLQALQTPLGHRLGLHGGLPGAQPPRATGRSHRLGSVAQTKEERPSLVFWTSENYMLYFRNTMRV